MSTEAICRQVFSETSSERLRVVAGEKMAGSKAAGIGGEHAAAPVKLGPAPAPREVGLPAPPTANALASASVGGAAAVGAEGRRALPSPTFRPSVGGLIEFDGPNNRGGRVGVAPTGFNSGRHRGKQQQQVRLAPCPLLLFNVNLTENLLLAPCSFAA